MAYPFPIEHLPPFEAIKAQVPLTMMALGQLHPTQYYVRIDRLQWLAGDKKPDGDDVPHVVTWRGKTYLYDGHHRWILGQIIGVTHFLVRNVVIPDRIEIEPSRCHVCSAPFRWPDNCPNCDKLGRACPEAP